jgi:RNA polymerase sigma-70 factor, ECF subfamily
MAWVSRAVAPILDGAGSMIGARLQPWQGPDRSAGGEVPVIDDKTRAALFERLVLPYADGGYNLARWLTRNDADAEDVMQEALLRAFRFVDGFSGDNPRAWLLSIVRNACFTWLRRNRPRDMVPLGEDGAAGETLGTVVPLWSSEPVPADLHLERQADRALLDRLIEAMPADGREVLVLREMEELSYKDIAEITGVPIGTVMSRLARARQRLLADWQRAAARGRPA